MKFNTLKVPVIIIAIGLVLAVLASLLTNVLKVPAITEQDFNYSVTYKLDGETETIDGVYRVRFSSVGKGTDPKDRYYENEFLTETDKEHPGAYTIAQLDDLELRIVFSFTNAYLMGEDHMEYAAAYAEPYFAVYDDQEIEYIDEETLGKFDAEILSWETPQPIENKFVFGGFSYLHDDSMLAMLVVGLLTIVACMIFVKRDKSVPYKALDKISVVLNFVIVFAAIPFITLGLLLMQIVVSGGEFVYQMYLCVPAIIAFSVAASIALRRKGFTKLGFFLQFVGPVMFAVPLMLESFL